MHGRPWSVRECEGEELERRLRRVAVIRSMDQAREKGRAKGFTLGRVLKAPVVEPPDMPSPLGAVDVGGASSEFASSAKGDRFHGQAMGHAAVKKTVENAERPGSQAPKAPG